MPAAFADFRFLARVTSLIPGPAGHLFIALSIKTILPVSRTILMECGVSRSVVPAAAAIRGTFFRTGLPLPGKDIALIQLPLNSLRTAKIYLKSLEFY
jgi:hypothetical protein